MLTLVFAAAIQTTLLTSSYRFLEGLKGEINTLKLNDIQ